MSHGGDTLPCLIGRPASILPKNEEELAAFWNDARNFYFDTAVAETENVFEILETFVKPGHLLYGSGTPFANNSIIALNTTQQDQYPYKDPEIHDQINRDNALELLPRLKWANVGAT